MVNTVTIKQEQLRRGFCKVGNGATKILLIGSCRSVPYVNYFAKIGDFTIYTLDPFNWNWDIADNRVDVEAAINSQENNAELLEVIRSCDVFIHEYYRNFGMFNTFKESEKNIYQFGVNAKIDLCLPNYHDVFVLFNDIIRFTPDIKAAAIGGLGSDTIERIMSLRDSNLERFYNVCAQTSFPEFADYFRAHHLDERMYWTYNHVSNAFTLPLFWAILQRMGIAPTQQQMERIKATPDIFANNYTQLTEYDVQYSGYKWNEPITKLNPSAL